MRHLLLSVATAGFAVVMMGVGEWYTAGVFSTIAAFALGVWFGDRGVFDAYL